MYQPLVPCPGCRRHVRATEAVCPFCAAKAPAQGAPRAPAAQVAHRRLSRAAAFVFGATVGVAACSGEAVVEPGGGGGEGGEGASTSSGGQTSSSGGVGGSGGQPVFDAGPDDDGGTAALYGDPAPVDAGIDDGGTVDDGGGGEPIYGAAPTPDTPPKNGL